jgi:hypothetical protein
MRGSTFDIRWLPGIFGTVRFASDGSGVIAVGTSKRAFVDDKGASAASGIAQNDVRSNVFGGRTPPNEYIKVFGLGVTVMGIAAADLADVQQLLTCIELKLTLGGEQQKLGPLSLYPSFLGVDTMVRNGKLNAPLQTFPVLNKGGKLQDLRPVIPPNSVIEAEFSVIEATAAMTLSSNFDLFLHLPAARALTAQALQGI